MPSKPLPISPAVSRLLRERREALGLTLRRVEELSAERGHPIPHSTLARIELGIFDPGVRRLGHLLNLYQLPIQAAGDVLDVEALAGVLPMEKDPAKLRDRALAAWRAGKVSEALSYFLAFRRRVPNDDVHRVMRQEAILAFAVAAGSLGKLHLSRQMLDELLLENPEPRMLVPILIQQSVVWRSMGSTVAATAFVDAATRCASPDAPKHHGWIQHQRAQILIAERKFGDAAKCLALAAKHHRRARSPHDEALALLGMAQIRFEERQPRKALAAALLAEKFAGRHKFKRIQLSAQVDRARALSATGSMEAAKKLLRAILADSTVADDAALSFYAHFYLWEAERDSGNAARAAMELQEAAYYSKFVNQVSSESKRIRQELGGASQPGRRRIAASRSKHRRI
jgi:transcriptional regulator with XRE-family HTH domain